MLQENSYWKETSPLTIPSYSKNTTLALNRILSTEVCTTLPRIDRIYGLEQLEHEEHQGKDSRILDQC